VLDYCVIGSGISGSTIANYLVKKNSVKVFDKANGLGGRSSYKRFKGKIGFDHGLQYISPKSREFKNFTKLLVKKKILKQKIINEHIDWIKKLKKEGINIKSGFLVDELKRPGDGGLLILEMNNYKNALKIIKNDPMIKNDLVEWKLNEWIDSNKQK